MQMDFLRSQFDRSTRAVVLMTGNPCVEESRKKLPRRFLSTIHRELISTIKSLRGLDLIIASDGRSGFSLEGPSGSVVRRCRDLGQRLETAFEVARGWGYESVVVLAADVIGLEPRSIRNAFDALERVDCVLAPSRDGGFSLVGLSLGVEIDWSRIAWFTDRATDGLRDEIDRRSLERVELPPIDDIDDRVTATRAARNPLVVARVRAALLGLLHDTIPVSETAVRPSHFCPPGTTRLRAPPPG